MRLNATTEGDLDLEGVEDRKNNLKLLMIEIANIDVKRRDFSPIGSPRTHNNFYEDGLLIFNSFIARGFINKDDIFQPIRTQ
jgi:hypothetical protein